MRATRCGRLLAAALLSSVGPAIAAGDGHPTTYVDKGACPFECCTYREWKVEHDAALRNAPRRDAPVVAKVVRGEAVTALTGNVVTVPARFTVQRDHGPYHRGESFWVYTYLGEGFFKIWRDGAMQEEQLDFSPYEGGTGGERCMESERVCWGQLDRPLQMTWWINLRDSHGVEGWSSDHELFSGSDACG